jgi:ABC-type spermidine/putrescine transport system permease subunit II
MHQVDKISQVNLKLAMINSPNYKVLTKERDEAIKEEEKQKKEFKQTFWYPLTIGLIGALVGSVLSTIGAYIVEVIKTGN